MDFEKQQRMLQRGIANLQQQARIAFASGLIQDYANFESSSREFKAFIRDNITAPEIVAYAAQILVIQHEESEPSVWKTLFMPVTSLFSGQSVLADIETIQDAKTVHGQYANLEILVALMEE